MSYTFPHFTCGEHPIKIIQTETTPFNLVLGQKEGHEQNGNDVHLLTERAVSGSQSRQIVGSSIDLIGRDLRAFGNHLCHGRFPAFRTFYTHIEANPLGRMAPGKIGRAHV